MVKCKDGCHIHSRPTRCKTGCKSPQSVKLKSVGPSTYHRKDIPKLYVKGLLITTTYEMLTYNRQDRRRKHSIKDLSQLKDPSTMYNICIILIKNFTRQSFDRWITMDFYHLLFFLTILKFGQNVQKSLSTKIDNK